MGLGPFGPVRVLWWALGRGVLGRQGAVFGMRLDVGPVFGLGVKNGSGWE